MFESSGLIFLSEIHLGYQVVILGNTIAELFTISSGSPRYVVVRGKMYLFYILNTQK